MPLLCRYPICLSGQTWNLLSLFIICSKFNLGQGPGKDFRLKSYGRDSRHKHMAYISIGNLLQELRRRGRATFTWLCEFKFKFQKNKLCRTVKKKNKPPRRSICVSEIDGPFGIPVVWEDQNFLGSMANYYYLRLVLAFENSHSLPLSVSE